MADETVQVCPNCGSLDVHVSRENVVDMMGLDHEYTCHNCQFTSKLFPEVPADNMEEFEDAFQDTFEDRYLNPDWGFSVSGSNHPRILLGGLLVLFGIASTPFPGAGTSFLAAIPFPGTVTPLFRSVALVIAGAAIIVYGLRHEQEE